MSFLRTLTLTVLLVLTFSPLAAAQAPEEIIVSAAASLTNALQELGKQYEQSHPQGKVVFNFAASGTLLQQLAKGAPVDVFASADQKTLDQAQEKDLIRVASRKNFASNRLVLIAPIGSQEGVTKVQMLTEPRLKRIALGNPAHVPAGRYAKEALVNLGLWEPLSDKYILGESVRQVMDYVSRGEVDVGFVYATDAALARDKVKVVQQIK